MGRFLEPGFTQRARHAARRRLEGALGLALHQDATSGEGRRRRGWYQTLYRDSLKGKSVLEFGSGLGLDGIEFARHGACLTFVDVRAASLEILERLCRLFDVKGDIRSARELGVARCIAE